MAINLATATGGAVACKLAFVLKAVRAEQNGLRCIRKFPKLKPRQTLDLRPESQALRILHNAKGKVSSVLYADKNGKHVEQEARAVCVAANSIESARLLLNSASSTFPDGLANSSGQVGRNYMRHTTGSVYAAFPQEVHMYRGTTMAGIVEDEARNDTARGLSAGIIWKPSLLVFRSWRRS